MTNNPEFLNFLESKFSPNWSEYIVVVPTFNELDKLHSFLNDLPRFNSDKKLGQKTFSKLFNKALQLFQYPPFMELATEDLNEFIFKCKPEYLAKEFSNEGSIGLLLYTLGNSLPRSKEHKAEKATSVWEKDKDYYETISNTLQNIILKNPPKSGMTSESLMRNFLTQDTQFSNYLYNSSYNAVSLFIEKNKSFINESIVNGIYSDIITDKCFSRENMEKEWVELGTKLIEENKFDSAALISSRMADDTYRRRPILASPEIKNNNFTMSIKLFKNGKLPLSAKDTEQVIFELSLTYGLFNIRDEVTNSAKNIKDEGMRKDFIIKESSEKIKVLIENMNDLIDAGIEPILKTYTEVAIENMFKQALLGEKVTCNSIQNNQFGKNLELSKISMQDLKNLESINFPKDWIGVIQSMSGVHPHQIVKDVSIKFEVQREALEKFEELMQTITNHKPSATSTRKLSI